MEDLRTLSIIQPPLKSFAHSKTLLNQLKSTLSDNNLLLKYYNNCSDKQFIKPVFSTFQPFDPPGIFPNSRLSYKMGFFFHSGTQAKKTSVPSALPIYSICLSPQVQSNMEFIMLAFEHTLKLLLCFVFPMSLFLGLQVLKRKSQHLNAPIWTIITGNLVGTIALTSTDIKTHLLQSS